jgi:integrase
MSDGIVVTVVDRGRTYLYLRYIDPVDGKTREKSSGLSDWKDAERAAWQWQSELNSGTGVSVGVMKWDAFRLEFTTQYLSNWSDRYASNVEGSLNVIQELMSPDTLTRINDAWISRFHLLAKKRGVSYATVKKYFQHLQTALNWAKERGYIKVVPILSKRVKATTKGGKLMKGRPITGEEFDRMLEAVRPALLAEVATKTGDRASGAVKRAPRAANEFVVESAEASLRYLMRGLWLSGLRLGEALSLTWDQWADGIRVRVDGKRDVCLMIDGENQKNRKTQVYPLVDEFGDFLLETPEDERIGFVFNPMGVNGRVSRRIDTVSNWIVEIGKQAKIKVDEKGGSEKFASAHDLRRAFGTRWAKIVPPSLLQQLMRHSSIETTMSYYVSISARDTMDEVRRHVRKNTGDIKDPSDRTVP